MLDSKFWKKYFKVYDALNVLIPYQDLMNAIIGDLEVLEDDLILDVGSGTGNSAVMLERTGATVHGVDSSAEGISLHREKSAMTQLTLHDITRPLPFPNNHFDKVCSNNTLYLLSPHERIFAVEEIFRVLMPGGKFVVANLVKGFSPYKIYADHVKKSLKQNGVGRTFLDWLQLLPATTKIFYYNAKIKKAHHAKQIGFFGQIEQRQLLAKCGFSVSQESKRVYSNQAILDVAMKPL